ncbi:TPA: helix-turn-helix transcriptional regulator [Vibrio vulnificus]|uniref:helix-turn-helix transcriptional regulator n=1 Tax=Vibrio vulnificus TaxID=672 RepID=UPI001FAEBA7D|nr:helix-turn-helix transcriptional regulator [Vibrio vulnificus]MCJ0804058.1 helix-turn-helix transcriptional regulator [Vibrio vulnificus]
MNQIKNYRNSIGATQKQLGDAVGVGQSTIDRYESGVRKLRVDQCWKIVNALNELGAKCSFNDVFPDPQPNTTSKK